MKAITLIFMLFACTVSSQDKVTLNIYQDTKLALVGDNEHGYSAGTLNLLVRSKWTGYQNKWGYLVVAPEFEFAELQEPYRRYSANLGYTLNKLIIDKAEATALVGWGWIDRSTNSSYSWSVSGELTYPVLRWMRVAALAQITQRQDLYDTPWRVSGFIGIEINLFVKQ